MTIDYADVLTHSMFKAIVHRLLNATRLDNVDGRVVDTGIPVYSSVSSEYATRQIIVRYTGSDNYIQLVGPVV